MFAYLVRPKKSKKITQSHKLSTSHRKANTVQKSIIFEKSPWFQKHFEKKTWIRIIEKTDVISTNWIDSSYIKTDTKNQNTHWQTQEHIGILQETAPSICAISMTKSYLLQNCIGLRKQKQSLIIEQVNRRIFLKFWIGVETLANQPHVETPTDQNIHQRINNSLSTLWDCWQRSSKIRSC